MQDHKSLERWADSVLDQHRTGPRIEGDPTEDFHRFMLGRLESRRRSFRALEKLEAFFFVVGTIVLAALTMAWLSLF